MTFCVIFNKIFPILVYKKFILEDTIMPCWNFNMAFTFKINYAYKNVTQEEKQTSEKMCFVAMLLFSMQIMSFFQ